MIPVDGLALLILREVAAQGGKADLAGIRRECSRRRRESIRREEIVNTLAWLCSRRLLWVNADLYVLTHDAVQILHDRPVNAGPSPADGLLQSIEPPTSRGGAGSRIEQRPPRER